MCTDLARPMGNHVLCSNASLHCTEKCTRITIGSSRDVSTLEGQLCDPAGAVFDETLQDLPYLDRQLLLFSSSNNVVAVRWLLRFGANRWMRDSNATTCLHAACRSGSPAIVQALLDSAADEDKDKKALQAADIAGWTPLHIAVFMGRNEVAVALLKAGAGLQIKNLAGQIPADLCSDARTQSVIGAFLQGSGRINSSIIQETHHVAAASVDSSGPELASSDDQVHASTVFHEVQFEPFFVPRTPVIRDRSWDTHFTKQLVRLGQAIFNGQPGRGLAFMVASGCTRDYPIDLVAFLRGSSLDQAQICVFLGEDFSLSKILRMEFINSISYLRSGVVGSLKKAFQSFKAPPDLQKIDRIIASLAEVWWRQHAKKSSVNSDRAPPSISAEGAQEMTGFHLRDVLPNSLSLHQLLFSSIMLHWNLHAAQRSAARMTLNDWLEMHRGLKNQHEDLPDRVLIPIFRILCDEEVPHLKIASPVDAPPVQGPPKPVTASFARIQGWVRVLGNGFTSPFRVSDDTEKSGNSSDCLQISSMLSEATASSRNRHPDHARHAAALRSSCVPQAGSAGLIKNQCSTKESATIDEEGWQTAPEGAPSLATSSSSRATNPESSQSASPPQEAPDAVWLSLCYGFLFFAASPVDVTPFAFIHLRTLQFQSIEPTKSMFTIDGGSARDASTAHAPLQLVFLLPDGRWHSVEMPRLAIEVCNSARLESWVLCLSELSNAGSVMESLKI